MKRNALISTLFVGCLSSVMASQAFGKTIATYSFNYSGRNFEDSVQRVIEVNIDDKQELVMRELSYNLDNNHPAEERQASHYLTPAAYSSLRTRLALLASADVVTEKRQVVCYMMPPRFAAPNHLYVVNRYDSESKMFSGKLRLVLSNSACYLTTYTHPSNDFMLQTAESSKAAIEALVLQALDQN